MEWLHVLLLGALQGVTEFLPISSSGHLVLAQHLLGFTEEGSAKEVFFDGMLHLGTLAAVLAYFAGDLRQQMRLALGSHRDPEAWPATPRDFLWLGLLVGLATLPAAIAGFTLDEAVKETFKQPRLVASNFLILGAVLLTTDLLGRWRPGTTTARQTRWWQALAIGLAQALSVVGRGLSRSGMTIAGALLVRLERSWAVRFSFLMSVVASLGLATLGLRKALKDPLRDQWLTPEFLLMTLAATAVSGLVGYATITPLIALVKRCALWWFAIYVWAVGILVLVLL